MATLDDADFESTYPISGWSEAGTVANIGTSTNFAVNGGTTSVRVNNTGGATTAWIASGARTARIRTARFYLRVDTKVSGTASIVQWTVTGGNVYLRLLTTGVIRLTLNTTNYAGPTLTDDTWYRIDIRVDTSANPWVVDWQVDGSAQTQRTIALAANNITADNVGIITSVTGDIYFDDFKQTDQAGDYPLGYSKSVSAENAAGTGAANNATKNMGPSSQASSGTGAAANTGKTLAAPIQASAGTGAAAAAINNIGAAAGAVAGTGAAADATVDIVETPADVDAPAEHIAATGAASAAINNIAAAAGNAAGTGAAQNISETIAASIQAASGTGAAQNAVGLTDPIADAELASGTGAAAAVVSSALAVGAGAATGTAEAYQPLIGGDKEVLAEVAAATGAALGLSSSISPAVEAALSQLGPIDFAFDDFGRTVSSGLGTADSGQAWTATGTATDYAVDGNYATFTHSAATQARRAWLPSVSEAHLEQTIKFKGPAPDFGEYYDLFIQTRQTAADGDYRAARIRIATPDGSVFDSLSLIRRAIGVETVLATYDPLQNPGGTGPYAFTADTFYTVRVRLLGQGMWAKYWKDGDGEPANWQVVAEDTQLTAPGGIGMRSYSPAGTYPMVISWEGLTAAYYIGANSSAFNAAPFVGESIFAAAISATGTGAVNTNAAAIQLSAGHTSGAGAATGTSQNVEASAEFIEGAGAAYDTSSPQVAANAGLTTGTGAAYQLAAMLTLAMDVSEGSGNAFTVAGVNSDDGLTRLGWHSGTAVAVFVRGAAIDTPPHAVGRAAATRSRAQ